MIQALEVAGAVLFSLGGGTAILFGLSSWLGRAWAGRILAADRAKYEAELERLRAQLVQDNEKAFVELRSQVAILQEKRLGGHKDKVEIYRVAVNLLADLLADIEITALTAEPPAGMFDRYNRGWMKVYGYLAMLAPQEVMDAFDGLNDYLLSVLKGKRPPQPWSETRKLALNLLNAVRRDIGFDPAPIDYHGLL